MSRSEAADYISNDSEIGAITIPIGTQMFVINQGEGVYEENILLLNSSQFLSMENEFVLTSPPQLHTNANEVEDPLVLKKPCAGENLEPPVKKKKNDNEFEQLKKFLMCMQQSFVSRLKGIEEKIEKIYSNYYYLEQKVEKVFTKVKDFDSVISNVPKILSSSDAIKANDVGISCRSSNISAEVKLESYGDNVTCTKNLISYSEGSWLGDPDNTDLRVRCTLSSKDLDTINHTCLTPEKMGLTLLDILFDRETQACSNISGVGKHGKAQLDPIKIHGIKCHLIYRFGLTDKGWQNMKQNIDSKCRSCFRRKQNGLSLEPRSGKSFSHRVPSSCELIISNPDSNPPFPSQIMESNSEQKVSFLSSESVAQNAELDQLGCSLSFQDKFGNSIINTKHGNIQVINATEEELEQLKRTREVEILADAGI